jgi:hypothetical protein
MYRRPIRRATILAITGVLVFAGTAFADQLLADGDVLNSGIQGTKPLGNVPAGGLVSADVEFTLNCVGLGHVDVGQSVILSWSGVGSAPLGGAIVSVTEGSVGPITDGWAADTQGCPSPTPTMVGATRSTVTLRAPTTPGLGYMYTIVYDRSLSPTGNNDSGAFSRTATQVSFTLNVVGNTAPTLNLPASHSEEGNTTGGWTADWSGVSATDPEDNPDPTPSCVPAAGNVLLVGQTTNVVCSVTDLGGATTTGSFDITVVDTTDPTLAGVPADRTVTTSDPGGAIVTYQSPTATDIVDASPTVACSPASGWTFPVGTTTVTCTATDASGNDSSGSFTVTVEFVAANTPPSLTVPPSHQEEGNTTGGWVADWSGVSATDPEDNPDPTPTCIPAAGTVLPLDLTTTVACSVTDSAGATTSKSFDITVVDTTAPVLAGVPSDRSLTTGDPRGAPVTFGSPTATDIVDAAPVEGCVPASGSTFGVGTTTVTCTATDASDNSSSATFEVNVEYVAPQSASAIWLEPVAGGSVFEANHGRMIPVKVSLFVDGVERSSGQARLTLTPCGGREVVLELPLTWGGGRWNAALDTSMLPGDCYTLAVSIDGLEAGLLRLELTGDASTARSKPSGTSAPTTTISPRVGPKKPR